MSFCTYAISVSHYEFDCFSNINVEDVQYIYTFFMF